MDKNLANYLVANKEIYINSEITSELAAQVIIQIHTIEKEFDENCTPSENRIINMWIIDCPGGSVSAGLAIYDKMRYSKKTKFCVHCCGLVASMAVPIALAADERIAYPHTEFLLHQPLGGAQGQASDILIQARHIEKIRSMLYGIIAERTGQTIKRVAQDSDRDFILGTHEAMEYGIITKIITEAE